MCNLVRDRTEVTQPGSDDMNAILDAGTGAVLALKEDALGNYGTLDDEGHATLIQ